jgi:4-amino-4-deoxy-L-arabinose transferase-like glycosyltransferase
MTRATWVAIVISIFAVAVRLIVINQPFEDVWSWRQSDVAAIARNYFQGGFHFAHPQIDWAGDSGGFVGTEFPVLPFVAAICYEAFGVHEWVGRIQALIFFAISLPFFFLLVRDNFGETAAVWALLFYAFAPVGIMASRCFMPDTPSLALSIIGLYFFDRWIAQEKSSPAFVASALCLSLSILIKVTSVLIAVPLACLTFQHFSFSAFRRFRVWLFAAIALAPAAIWYWHAYQISLAYYPHHFFGAGGVKMMAPGWYLKIAREIPTTELTPLLVIAGIVGLVASKTRSRAQPFIWWMIAMILFIIVVGYGNRHPWYRLPLVPIAAVFGGVACAFIAGKIAARPAKLIASILLVAVFGFSAIDYARKFYRPIAAPMRQAGLKLKEITPAGSLIAAADNGDPTVFYYAERKGWHFLEKDGIYYGDPDGSEPAIVDLEQLRGKGATYLAFTSNTAWWLDLYPELKQYVDANSALVATSSEFRIYRLNPK